MNEILHPEEIIETIEPAEPVDELSWPKRDLKQEIVALVHSGKVFTDLIIEQDCPVVAKVPGGFEEVSEIKPVSRELMANILLSMDPNWDDTIKTGAINRPFDLMEYRLRINAYLAYGGEKVMMTVRKNPLRPMPLRATGLPETVRIMIEARKGLILVNGSTGCGKSTSLAALVDAINETRSSHIITIEDPIEYLFQRKKAVFSQREIGVDVGSFYEGARDAMRQVPDVIVIGEIRDRDTAETAMLAAESGALVIGTLHANGASTAVHKLLAFFSAQEREAKRLALEHTLIGVISQLLLPTPDRAGWALASELLFNNKTQCVKALSDPTVLHKFLEDRVDGLSRSMSHSVFDLMKTGRVSKTDAIMALTGQNQVHLLNMLKQERV